ncbi:MAG: PspC domain-containing protein [Balneolales bacterium]
MARLTKSITDKMLFGVCGGIAEYLGWNSTIVRIIFLVAAFIGFGSPILVYFILALAMPKY